MRSFRTLALLLGLTACSANVMPAAAPAVDSASRRSPERGYLSIRIVVPRHQRGHRSARYISPATQSIAVTVLNAAHQPVEVLKQNLTPGSPGCTPAGGHPASCSIAIALNPGGYSANVVTYDGLAQSGNRLSETDGFPFSILKGRVNEIPVVLDGVPASVVVLADANASFLGGSQRTGFQLAGMRAQVVDVYGRDADQNVILGAGAPAVSLASNSSNLVVAATGSKNPNQFAVRRASFQRATITLTASALPAGGGSAIVATAGLQMVPLTYIYQSQGIGEYVPWSAAPVLTIASAVTGTMGSGFFIQRNGVLALDAAGNLYILDPANADVVVYAPGATTATRTISSGIASQPAAIALDSAGTLYVANQSVDSITEYAPGSSVVERAVTSGISGPNAIAVDSSGNLFVMNVGANAVTEYAPGATVPSRTITSGVVDPYGIGVDGFGNLYVGSGDNGGNNTVTIYTPGSTSIANTLDYGTSTYGAYVFLGGLVVDASGDVCVAAEPGTLECGSVAEGGFVGHVNGFPSTENFSSAMTFDAAGQLYVGNLQTGPEFVRVYPAFAEAGFTPNMDPIAVLTGNASAYGIAVQL